MGRKNFKSSEVLISTHKDKGHIHNHFVVNSASLEDGRKLRYSNKQLQNFKNVNDRICERE
ncbi:mobilisation protein [Clostridium sporogenes]|nr:relaxase/mobilization nuclease domain-containing protein [Clostridium sporogenes]SUY65085.1 mobilisation protein [Clostridium sporogenes]